MVESFDALEDKFHRSMHIIGAQHFHNLLIDLLHCKGSIDRTDRRFIPLFLW